jgi:hypothetical protein
VKLHLLIILAIALVLRVLLLASASVSFHSDEAIVALMARHFTQGATPPFFYGQAYMGSLDAWLVSLGFRVLGESVLTIRIVQSILYLCVVASTYGAAWALTRSRWVASVSALSLAIATPLLALYTTATLGGYNETLLFGNLLIMLGMAIVRPNTAPAQMNVNRLSLLMATFAFIMGVAWWTNGLILIYAVPMGLLVLAWLLRAPFSWRRKALLIGVLLACFLIGGGRWWLYALENDLAPIRFFIGGDSSVGAAISGLPFAERVLGLLLFGIPALIGLRFPWSGEFFLGPVGLIILLVYVLGLYRLDRTRDDDLRAAKWISFGMIGLFVVVYLATRFSSDPSGRYFLPLALPLGVALGVLTERLPTRRLGAVLVVGVLAYHGLGQIAAAGGDFGFTTQFVAETHLPNDDDAALIGFLEERGLTHGYTNYWINFRLAFLSGERLQYSAALPDKDSLDYSPAFERYAPYREASDIAERIAYINPLLPEVGRALEAWFAAEGITYTREQVGIYTVYYDFAPRIPRPPLPFIVD